MRADLFFSFSKSKRQGQDSNLRAQRHPLFVMQVNDPSEKGVAE